MALLQHRDGFVNPTVFDGMHREGAQGNRLDPLVGQGTRTAEVLLVQRAPPFPVAEVDACPGEAAGRDQRVVLIAEFAKRLRARFVEPL
jgi:hypothetical protein